MVYNDKRQWVLAGITSNGIGCARPDAAGVYTRVVTYESWIKSYVTDARWVPVQSSAQGRHGSVVGAFLLAFFIGLRGKTIRSL